MKPPPWPRLTHFRYPATDTMDTTLMAFVEHDGVRLDNAGPLPLKQAKRLRDWLTKFIAVAEIRQHGR